MDLPQQKKQGALVVCEEQAKTWSLRARTGPQGKRELSPDQILVRLGVRTAPKLPRYASEVMAAVRIHLHLFCRVDLAGRLILSSSDEEGLRMAAATDESPWVRYTVLPAELTAQNLAEWLSPIFRNMFSKDRYYRLEFTEIELRRGSYEAEPELGRA